MARIASEEIKQHWKDIILQQRKSNLSIPVWCRQNAITVYTFYYWKQKLFPKNLNRSTFTELHEKEADSNLTLEYRGVSIRLGKNFDESLLKRCLEVLKKC